MQNISYVNYPTNTCTCILYSNTHIYNTLYSRLQSPTDFPLLLNISTLYCFTSNRLRTKEAKFDLFKTTPSNLRAPNNNKEYTINHASVYTQTHS